jgi:hypothetical protein
MNFRDTIDRLANLQYQYGPAHIAQKLEAAFNKRRFYL